MRQILLLLLSVLTAAVAQADKVVSLVSGTLASSYEATTPKREIVKTTDGVEVTYWFNSAYLQNDDVYNGAYIWKIPGFGNDETSAKPAVPFRKDRFLIPSGCTASVSIIEQTYVERKEVLGPGRQPLVDSSSETYSTENVKPIARYLGFYPSKIVNNTETEIYRGSNILVLSVNPIQYSYAEKTVRAYTKIKYKITFSGEGENSDDSALSSLPLVDSYLSNIVLNGYSESIQKSRIARQEEASLSPERIIVGPVSPYVSIGDYLIITTDKLKPAAEKLALWKKKLGYNAVIKSQASWSSETDVKDEIVSFFINPSGWYPGLLKNSEFDYLLILGDNKEVPARQLGSYLTDYYYGCLDGDDDKLADIYRGRIPASSLSEANIVVDKIINYEKNPPKGGSYYTHAINAAMFQDSETVDGYEDRRFTLTSEEIRDILMQKGYNIERIYDKTPNCTPTHWSTSFAKGKEIPSDLKTYIWYNTRTPINNVAIGTIRLSEAIEEGCFYVLHRGHGSATQWGNPSYSFSNVKNLKNKDLLPIVFSINCKTGTYKDQQNFSRRLLINPNGGAASVIAATATSYSGYNDAFVGGMFDAVWPNSNLIPVIPNAANETTTSKISTPVKHLGQILDQGLARMSEMYIGMARNQYTKEIFHCLGDPSLNIYSQMPGDIWYTTKLGPNNLTVSFTIQRGENVIVSVHDLRKNTVTTSRCGGSFPIGYPDSVVFCLSGPGLRPIELTGTEILKQHTFPVLPPVVLTKVNSVSNSLDIEVDVNSEVKYAEIVVTDIYGEQKRRQRCEISADQKATARIEGLESGLHVVTVVADGVVSDSKQVIIK